MLRRFFAPFVEFGPLAGSLYIADRILSRLSPKLGILVYELMVQPIPTTPILPPTRAGNLRVKELKPGDPDLGHVIAPPAVQEYRFAQNSTCLATYRDGRLLGYIWLCFGAYNEDEARCTFTITPPGRAVFDYDLVVLPEFRMGLGFAAVWHCTAEYLRKRKIEFSFSRITRFNLISRRSHARLGAVRIGRTVIVKLRELEIFVSTTPPYLQVCGASNRASVPMKYCERHARRISSAH